jgi:hypothetical protein
MKPVAGNGHPMHRSDLRHTAVSLQPGGAVHLRYSGRAPHLKLPITGTVPFLIVSHCRSLLHFQIIKKAGGSESCMLPDSPACLRNGICSYEKSGAFFEKPEQIKKGTAAFAIQTVATTVNAENLSLDIKSHLWTDSFSCSYFRVNCGTSTVVNME